MKKTLAIILALAMTMFLYCSCGSNYAAIGDMNYFSYDNADMCATEGGDYGWFEADMIDYDYEKPMVATAASEVASNGQNIDVPKETSEKIIKNGSLSLETLEFDRFISELESSVNSFGGYVESSEQWGSVGYRYSNYTVRIPSQHYDAFVALVGDMGTITSSNESVTNVTLQYIDIEARLNSLIAERDSFMKLMDRAETIEEILKIQGYLTDVNYQIESYTSQLNSLKNKVSYSTITISINEVERVTPPAPKTVGERISTQLSQNLYDIGEGFKDLTVWFISSLPYLAIYAVIIAVIVFVVISVSKSTRKKQEKKMAELANKYPNGFGMAPTSNMSQWPAQTPSQNASSATHDENKDK